MRQKLLWTVSAGLRGMLVVISAVTAAQSKPTESATQQEFLKKLAAAAVERTQHVVRYEPGYVGIPYPGGDVPADTGVCTDEVIRAYRTVGVDLQKEVHEDMKKNFSEYPRLGAKPAKRPDTNIDHRRVPNLMVFFSRKGEALATTERREDYAPGDLVTWDLGGGVPHIGIVVDRRSLAGGRYLIVHNIGRGPKMEDVLFDWKITGHYRYFGPPAPQETRRERSSALEIGYASGAHRARQEFSANRNRILAAETGSLCRSLTVKNEALGIRIE